MQSYGSAQYFLIMKDFFDYDANQIKDAGYALFGRVHVFIIILCFLFIILSICIHKRKLSSENRTSMCRLYAIIPVFLIIMRSIYVITCGVSIIYELPLHLCSMTAFICMIFEFIKPSFFRSMLGQTLYALCLPGALMAVLFPDGTSYPPIHFITIESHMFHALIIAYICLRISDGSIIPSIKEVYKCIVFLLVVVPLVLLFDSHFDTNYMFLMHPSNVSPLTGFYTYYGYGGYLTGYGFVVFAVISLMNLSGMFVNRLIRRIAKVSKPDLY